MSTEASHHDTIETFLREHPLVRLDTERRRDYVNWRMGRLLPSDLSSDWIGLLSWFTEETPRSYWDIETVTLCVELLERNIGRSVEAIRSRSDRAELIFRNLDPLLSTTYDDAPVGFLNTATIIRLTDKFHPDYLWCAEHIFGHLISIYSGITIRRPGSSKFDLGGSIKHLADDNYYRLIDGYDDRIRNAIAHGQINFSANGVIYGQYSGVQESPPWDVAQKFDRLWRTCAGLALGLLLFFARNKNETAITFPAYLKYLLATKALAHEGMTLYGFSESTVADLGKQLHISLKVSPKTRYDALHEISLISSKLVQSGLTQFARYVFNVDSGIEPSGLVIVNVQTLARLILEKAKWTRLREAFEDPILLWHDEGSIRSRIQAFSEILTAATRQAKHDFFKKLGTDRTIA